MNGIIAGLGIPVIGTVLGSACVFFIKDKINPYMNNALLGFAAGIMVAASIWSLLIPAIKMSAPSGFMKIFPLVVSFILGMGFWLLLDILTPRQHAIEAHSEEPRILSSLDYFETCENEILPIFSPYLLRKTYSLMRKRKLH